MTANLKDARLLIEIVPPKPERLATSKSNREHECVQRLVTVTLKLREKEMCLLWGESSPSMRWARGALASVATSRLTTPQPIP